MSLKEEISPDRSREYGDEGIRIGLKMKVVFKSMNHVDAQLRKTYLESLGIACNILNEGIRAAYGELPPIELDLVVIDEHRFEEAQALLVEFERGTITTGNRWTCKSCGESSEAQFTECWKCGGTKV